MAGCHSSGILTLGQYMKSQMIHEVIVSLLYDLHRLYKDWFGHGAYTKTANKIAARMRSEGIAFLTKQLPRLGKSFDKALCDGAFDYTGFVKDPSTGLPRFLGEFFVRIFTSDGLVRSEPCTDAIKAVRQVLFLSYKYELPYDTNQEATVCADFVCTDSGLPDASDHCQISERSDSAIHEREAKRLLARVFANFDPHGSGIVPRHGPGSVATGESAWEKWTPRRLYQPIDAVYPYTEFYYSGLTQVCDEYDDLQALEVLSAGTAKVVLVPKDSRGPRLISMEPLEYQWIQQGLSRAIVSHVESHPLTRGAVHFTNQDHNRDAALQASKTGDRATLDMKEASDRVSLSLVRALFPSHIVKVLEATRTSATELPTGEIVQLKKFAPMGSCLCFPIEALAFWAILVADRMVRLGEKAFEASSKILVFGDDIVVPCSDAHDAMRRLEEYHLKVNTSKSCTKGFFRESCGVDAYRGVNVTPVRIKRVWRHRRDPSVYDSWISYANSLHERGFKITACFIAQRLAALYGAIPRCLSGNSSYPALRFDPIGVPEPRTRFSKPPKDVSKPYYGLTQQYVWYLRGSTHKVNPDRWCELFRSLTLGSVQVRAGSYAIPRRSMLRRGWR